MAGQIPPKNQSATGPKPTGPKPKTTTRRKPGTAVAKVTKPEDKSDFTPAKAKALTEKIKKGATTTYEDITKAYAGRIWIALGHKTWDEYCDKHFDGVPLALPREKKKQAIQSLASAGMSTRAIAAATDVSQRTAARAITDPAPGESNGSPEVIDAEVVDVKDEPESREVKGKDGKTYNVTPSEKKEVVVNVVSVARAVAKELDSVRIRLDALFSRDDYEEAMVAVQGTLETAVSDFLDTIADDFIDLLRGVVAEKEPESEPELV